MIIVSDTTPFRYLVEIEVIEILSDLFGNVIIPQAVAEELQHPKTPQDEAIGRAEAKRVGLFILPTLTILERAAVRGLLDLPETIGRLSKTSFRASPKLIQETLERDHQRKQEMGTSEHPE